MDLTATRMLGKFLETKPDSKGLVLAVGLLKTRTNIIESPISKICKKMQ
jgi:hypothetical protein